MLRQQYYVTHETEHNYGKNQSVYKAHRSTETALLRVYNDVVFNIDRGNCTLLVSLDLSAAFDTINHQFFFHILEHLLGITDSALDLSNPNVALDRINLCKSDLRI